MIVWIASYPKSGNTWVRAFLSTYLYPTEYKFNLNLLDKIGEFPDHDIYKKYTRSKNFHNLNEISKYWITSQNFINSKKKLTFLKTHNSMCSINGNSFTDEQNTSAFIYIVRDPRNVVLSMSNHFSCSQKESFEFIIKKNFILYPKLGNKILPSTFVGDWNSHYKSWVNFGSVKKIIIKYEDLIENTKDTFKKIIIFLNKQLNIEYREDKIINSIDATSFENLKKYEEKFGFKMGQRNKFFYLGKENNWQNLLEVKIEKEIKNKFQSTMRELKYI